MMKRKEKKIITIESYSRTTMRLRCSVSIAWCKRCATETVMLTANEAAAAAQTTAREIFRRVETDKIHFLETEAGALLVCRNSLLD